MTDELRQELVKVLKKDISYLKRLLTSNVPKDVQERLLNAGRLPGESDERADTLSELALAALSTTRYTLFTLETPDLVL